MTTKTAERSGAADCSIIALDQFIQATRDSGYKGYSERNLGTRGQLDPGRRFAHRDFSNGCCV